MSTEEHNLVLILARGLASSIATPMLLVDPDGTVVYFNEPAEEVLGESYAEVGELTRDEFLAKFYANENARGEKVPPGELPVGVALGERRPAHRTLDVTRPDGEQRTIAVTAFPLFARTEELAGALAIFWVEDQP